MTDEEKRAQRERANAEKAAKKAEAAKKKAAKEAAEADDKGPKKMTDEEKRAQREKANAEKAAKKAEAAKKRAAKEAAEAEEKAGGGDKKDGAAKKENQNKQKTSQSSIQTTSKKPANAGVSPRVSIKVDNVDIRFNERVPAGANHQRATTFSKFDPNPQDSSQRDITRYSGTNVHPKILELIYNMQ